MAFGGGTPSLPDRLTGAVRRLSELLSGAPDGRGSHADREHRRIQAAPLGALRRRVSASPLAVIPVAGVGTRLRPHTHTLPKVLLHVAGKPIIAHILDDLPDLGIREAVLIVGYMGDLVRECATRNYPPLKTRLVDQPERRMVR